MSRRSVCIVGARHAVPGVRAVPRSPPRGAPFCLHRRGTARRARCPWRTPVAPPSVALACFRSGRLQAGGFSLARHHGRRAAPRSRRPAMLPTALASASPAHAHSQLTSQTSPEPPRPSSTGTISTHLRAVRISPDSCSPFPAPSVNFILNLFGLSLASTSSVPPYTAPIPLDAKRSPSTSIAASGNALSANAAPSISRVSTFHLPCSFARSSCKMLLP
jgi:hypothetical protein